jgi:hypothetical protein
LLVTPDGESVLIDRGGQREGREPGRVMAALRAAGVDRIDVFVATHLHNDHVGGLPELAERVPIGMIVDYGEPLGIDRMVNNVIRTYRPVRDAHTAQQVKPGDRLPLTGVRAEVVSAGGDLLETPLAGAGQATPGCDRCRRSCRGRHGNFCSVGLMIEHGAFRFLALGDLSGNTLTRIVCPIDRLGPVSVYLVAHHGDYDSTSPRSTRRCGRVAVLNNSAFRQGRVAGCVPHAARPGRSSRICGSSTRRASPATPTTTSSPTSTTRPTATGSISQPRTTAASR